MISAAPIVHVAARPNHRAFVPPVDSQSASFRSGSHPWKRSNHHRRQSKQVQPPAPPATCDTHVLHLLPQVGEKIAIRCRQLRLRSPRQKLGDKMGLSQPAEPPASASAGKASRRQQRPQSQPAGPWAVQSRAAQQAISIRGGQQGFSAARSVSGGRFSAAPQQFQQGRGGPDAVGQGSSKVAVARSSEAGPAPVVDRFVPPTSGELITMKPPIIVRDLAERLRAKPFRLIADLMGLKRFRERQPGDR